MERIQSSTIKAIEYLDDEATLVVEFIRSGTYEYFDVPKSVYMALMTAPSKGVYLSKYIKDKYIHEKV